MPAVCASMSSKFRAENLSTESPVTTLTVAAMSCTVEARLVAVTITSSNMAWEKAGADVIADRAAAIAVFLVNKEGRLNFLVITNTFVNL